MYEKRTASIKFLILSLVIQCALWYGLKNTVIFSICTSNESSLQGMASGQSQIIFAFAVCWGVKAALLAKKSKMPSWENFRQTGFQLLASKQSVLANYGILVAKNLILLDPSKTKMVSYSAMRRTSLVDGESILRSLKPSTLLHHRTHTRYV